MDDKNEGESPHQEAYCKNHTSIQAGYFVAQQPWVKYCKNCALNVALCGRKIEKQLTPQEFERKLHISSVVNDLKKNISEIEENAAFYKVLTELLQEASKPLGDRIHQIEKTLKQLSQEKEKLQKMYQDEIASKITLYLEKQSRMALQSQEVKKELQSIESNFGTLIEMQDAQDFETQNGRWSSILLSNRKEIIPQQEFSQAKMKIDDIIEHFYMQFETISRFRIDLQLDFRHKNSNEDHILAPVDENSSDCSNLVEELKLNLRANAQLKLRNNKKTATDRDNKKSNKRGSITIQNQQWPAPKRYNH